MESATNRMVDQAYAYLYQTGAQIASLRKRETPLGEGLFKSKKTS